jgi:beta-N-acetylhexosaminidase
MAMNAGIDILIFRDVSDDSFELIEQLAEAVIRGDISEEHINESFEKILFYKSKYNILKKPENRILNHSDILKSQNIIDNIAKNSIKILKKGNLIPIPHSKNKKITILSPDKSHIYNLSLDKGTLGEYLTDFTGETNLTEISYSLNPDLEEIQKIKTSLNSESIIIFISYNALFNQGQIDLFNAINNPIIAIAAGIPYDVDRFTKADSILLSFCYKSISLKALSFSLLSDSIEQN